MSRNDLARSGRILVVDDAAENVRILHNALKDEYQVIFALEGSEALEIARTGPPDLILLDAVMPAMDGFAVCAELQKSSETADVPVIFVTALESPEDETRALEAGAVDFIHKPINAAVVRARVRTHLTLKRQSDKLRETMVLLASANEALLRSNRDLQQFAHVAAHDLQAPLSSVAGCARRLSEESRGRLNDDAEKYLGYMVDNVDRMQALIRDLLTYARLDAQPRPSEPTGLDGVLDEVLQLLAEPLQAAKAEVERGALPRVMADRNGMIQVLTNLIENGLKYNQRRPPRIAIHGRRAGDQWVVSVQDNGIGMEPKDHRRIFEIFRRLHSSDEYPGSGIGLAICERIVARHGGRMWVESQAGQGSTFYFSLPAAEPSDAAA